MISAKSTIPARYQPLACAIAVALLGGWCLHCDQPKPASEPTATGPAPSQAEADTAPPAEVDGTPTGAGMSSGDTYYVTYRTTPDPIPLNQMFSIDVHVYDGASRTTPVDDITLYVDGRMPAHRHGMNTTPRIEHIGPGHFRVRGMLFHMPGDWELDFDVERAGVAERAQFAVTLE